MLTVFRSTYICEQTFSLIKSKKQTCFVVNLILYFEFLYRKLNLRLINWLMLFKLKNHIYLTFTLYFSTYYYYYYMLFLKLY